jgi:cell shape-determining protein MreC
MNRGTIILMVTCIVLVLYITHLEKTISKFETYYYNVEAVLDSVNNVCDDFGDNVLEEDYYYDYEKAREEAEKIDNIKVNRK